jgi:hypothetical protein
MDALYLKGHKAPYNPIATAGRGTCNRFAAELVFAAIEPTGRLKNVRHRHCWLRAVRLRGDWLLVGGWLYGRLMRSLQQCCGVELLLTR